jgi:16S rRNA (guanine966-N2)-methyltransferase
VSLRVISGSARGRKLKSVPGDTTRPITDRAKEALFDILAGEVGNSDLNRAPIETIKWNLEHCGFASKAEIRRGDAFTMLAAHPDRDFEFIYIAPPQFKGLWSQALLALDGNPGWLTETGWGIVQIAPKEYRELELGNLEEVDRRKYGSTLLVFYERKEA